MWFCRLWAVAALAHIIGNGPNASIMDWPGAVRVSLFVLGGLAVAVLLRPTDRRLVGALAAMVVVTAWLEAPFLANHWQLAALVSLVLLVALTRADPWALFSATARWMLLAFYGWAAFAKLNEDFADTSVSCARDFANQALGAVGLPEVSATNVLADGAVWGTTGIELLVVPLLLVRRTRAAGIGLAMLFHFVISLDFDQHFYDFTAVLLALFSLFLADARLDRLGSLQVSERMKGLMPGVIMALVFLSVSDPGSGAAGLVRYGAFVLWIPAGAWVIWNSLFVGSVDVARRRLGSPGPLGLAMVAVVLLIGAMPYLGVRTATAWNMYGNLLTHDGQSNHLVIGSAASWRIDTGDFVEILETSDEELQPYVDQRLLVPRASLRHHLADQPDVTITYRDHGAQLHETTGAEWGHRVGVLERKLLFNRSVDENAPISCQATVGAIG